MLNCVVKFKSDFPPMAKEGDECVFIDGRLHYKTGWVSPNQYDYVEEFMEHNPDAIIVEVEKKHPIKNALRILFDTIDFAILLIIFFILSMVVTTLSNDAVTQFAIWFSTSEGTILELLTFGSLTLSVLIRLGLWLYKKACN